jgi:AcrR family transcriptional regulator
MALVRTGISPQALSDQRRAVLLKVATTEFLANGYSKTSIETISKKSGVSKNTIYKHFASKKDLFEAVFETNRFPIDSIELDIADPAGSLHALAVKFRRIMSKPAHLELTRALIAEYPHMKATVAKLRRYGVQQQMQPLVSYFRELITEGKMLYDDPESAATHFGVIAIGGFRLFLEPAGSAAIENNRLHRDIDFFIRGCGICIGNKKN